MTIEENLTLLANTKESIRQAINNKGGEIETGTPFSGYANAISSLPSGGQEVLPEGVYAIDVTSTGETPASSDIDWYAGFASIQSFDPEGTRYQDRYINVWTTAPASSGNPDYVIHITYDTRAGAGVAQDDAWRYSPIYISYGYAVKEVEDPAIGGNTIWLAFFSARETGRYYIQVVDNDHPLIGSNYALPPSGEIPEGLWKFNISQEGGTNVIWVEGFMTNDKSNTWQETVVNIYGDPNGEPVNSITYSYNSKLSDEEVSQTNSAAGLYAEQYNVFDTSNDPIVLGLSCNTAGDYYIEVADHANPRFYDDTITQIYPDNHVNS